MAEDSGYVYAAVDVFGGREGGGCDFEPVGEFDQQWVRGRSSNVIARKHKV